MYAHLMRLEILWIKKVDYLFQLLYHTIFISCVALRDQQPSLSGVISAIRMMRSLSGEISRLRLPPSWPNGLVVGVPSPRLADRNFRQVLSSRYGAEVLCESAEVYVHLRKLFQAVVCARRARVRTTHSTIVANVYLSKRIFPSAWHTSEIFPSKSRVSRFFLRRTRGHASSSREIAATGVSR